MYRSTTSRTRSTGARYLRTTGRSSCSVTSSTASAISWSDSAARSASDTGIRSTRTRSRTTGTRRSTASVVTYLRSRAVPTGCHSVVTSRRSSRQVISTGGVRSACAAAPSDRFGSAFGAESFGVVSFGAVSFGTAASFGALSLDSLSLGAVSLGALSFGPVYGVNAAGAAGAVCVGAGRCTGSGEEATVPKSRSAAGPPFPAAAGGAGAGAGRTLSAESSALLSSP